MSNKQKIMAPIKKSNDNTIKVNQKMRDALNSIRVIAMHHPSFNEELYKGTDLDAIQEIGGDTADWTILAIIANAGLS